jgi:phosphatidylinositol alpha-mannosyltransferase
MRVALSHVYSWPEVRRGGERYLHEMAAALRQAGHDVRILSTSASPHQAEVMGVPVTYLRRRSFLRSRFGSSAEDLAFGMQSALRLLPRPPDVWHALGPGDAAAAATLGRVTTLATVFTVLGVPYRWYWEGRPDRQVHDVVVRHIDRYVCLSEAAGDALRQGWGREPDVVNGGVDVDRFKPGRRHPHPVLLYSGNVDDPRKNVLMLVEAAGILRRRVPDLELWISGTGDLASILRRAPAAGREAVVDLGRGTEEEHIARYAAAWVTVLPSYYEAFGLCLVESLASGTPIVVLSGGGGPTEIVRPGLGTLADPTSSSLADACEQALELAATPGVDHACRAAAMRYDWSTSIVPQIERIYTEASRSG